MEWGLNVRTISIRKGCTFAVSGDIFGAQTSSLEMNWHFMLITKEKTDKTWFMSQNKPFAAYLVDRSSNKIELS